MKKLIFYFVIISVLCESCSLDKRHYRPGFNNLSQLKLKLNFKKENNLDSTVGVLSASTDKTILNVASLPEVHPVKAFDLNDTIYLKDNTSIICESFYVKRKNVSYLLKDYRREKKIPLAAIKSIVTNDGIVHDSSTLKHKNFHDPNRSAKMARMYSYLAFIPVAGFFFWVLTFIFLGVTRRHLKKRPNEYGKSKVKQAIGVLLVVGLMLLSPIFAALIGTISYLLSTILTLFLGIILVADLIFVAWRARRNPKSKSMIESTN